MYRGVNFEVSQSQNSKILTEILNGIDVDNYFWLYIDSQSETYSDSFGTDFFDKERYSGLEFSKHIQNPHYIIFLKLQVYDAECKQNEIQTYAEFLESKCKLLILINDCTFVEIYTKENEIAEAIYKNACDKGFKNVTYITQSNDSRKEMNVI